MTGQQWLQILGQVVRMESAPIWLPIVSVHALEPDLFACRYRTQSLRRGEFVGEDCRLDESIEGADIQENHKGRSSAWDGTVRLVEENNEQFVVRRKTGRAPAPKDTVLIYPHSYLLPAKAWLEQSAARHSPDPCQEIRRRIQRPARLQTTAAATAAHIPLPLRDRQRDTLALIGKPLGVCWGPPGTGKTTTLAALVCGLVQRDQRVLVVAPTRIAADGACLALDKLLSRAGHPRRRGDVLRVQTPQLAEQFRAQNPDLLIWDDEHQKHTQDLIDTRKASADARTQILIRAGVDADEARRAAVHAEEAEEAIKLIWKEKQARLRATAKVVVSTVRTAINQNFAREFQDIIVDEASMVSLSDGLILAWQQRSPHEDGSLLLFGDHMQLGPIPPRLQTAGEDAAPEEQHPSPEGTVAYWLARDILSTAQALGGASITVMLNEQSRMNPVLCRVVAQQSYHGELHSTPDAPPPGLPPHIPGGICVVEPNNPPPWLSIVPLPWVRFQGSAVHQMGSAQVSVALARHLAACGVSVLLCSPYRAQASLIRRGVADLPAIRAGTIHRIQGQEADICIFDPAQPHRWFIKDSPQASRLINVAASRARHALILSNDKTFLQKNPLLSPYVSVAQDLT